MDFDLREEQQMVRNSVREFAANEIAPVAREYDEAENSLAVKEGFRVLSAYTLPKTGEKIWIITEADRLLTTILLPEEY